MSTAQRNDACLVSVDPSTVDILRRQTLVVLEANHYFFEELLQFGPEAQFALSVMYRDAFAVLDAIGWSPDPGAGIVDVPLTDGHIDQLRRCRFDLGHTNINRPRPSIGSSPTTPEPPPPDPAPLTRLASARHQRWNSVEAGSLWARTRDSLGERQRYPFYERNRLPID
jgi:hypothetical protein